MLITMASPKEKMVNVRLRPAIHDDFKMACELRGASMSSLLHQFIVRTIREEKEREPQAFTFKLEPGQYKVEGGTLNLNKHPAKKKTGTK